jgi:hypothetical protein
MGERRDCRKCMLIAWISESWKGVKIAEILLKKVIYKGFGLVWLENRLYCKIQGFELSAKPL